MSRFGLPAMLWEAPILVRLGSRSHSLYGVCPQFSFSLLVQPLECQFGHRPLYSNDNDVEPVLEGLSDHAQLGPCQLSM